jgi:hypothetical protein
MNTQPTSQHIHSHTNYTATQKVKQGRKEKKRLPFSMASKKCRSTSLGMNKKRSTIWGAKQNQVMSRSFPQSTANTAKRNQSPF